MSRMMYMKTAMAIAAGVLLVLIAAVVPVSAGDGTVTPEPQVIRSHSGDSDNPAVVSYVPHQLIVKLRTGDTVRFSDANEIVQGYSAALGESPVFLVALDPAVDVLEAATTFSQSPQVEYAQPNFVLNHSHPIQGSYPFSDVKLKGDYDGQYAATQLGLSQAHQSALGTGVVVGVIDGGIDVTHPALGGKAVSGYDFVDDDNDANDEPGGQASGHGTFVAGVIHLVAPSATIRSYRVMNASGDGDGFTVARAIERAVADGCSIINISLALTDRNLAVRDAIDMASANGILVVCGAGNLGGSDPIYPAAESNALAVAALDSLSHKTGFSNFGTYVDLCAPGADIYSAYQKPYMAWWSGTSFSAPFVSGLAALAKEEFPGANALQLRGRLMQTADNLDVQNPDYIGGLGTGIVNPYAALTGSVSSDTAVFIPDTLRCTYEQYCRLLVVPWVTGVLLSTNAPAPYVPHIVDTGTFAFAMVDDTAGSTNDSVDILLRTTDELGTYYNIIAFDVVGVANPAEVVVQLNVVPQDTTGTVAWLNPPAMWFTGNIHTYSVLNGASFLSSSNSPAAYYAEIPSGSEGFLMLYDSVGQTNDSVRFGVIPSRVPMPGLYADTILYHVAGIPEPAVLIVNLTATDSTTQATAYVNPSEVWYTGSITSDTFFLGAAYLSSTNAPAYYNNVVLPAGGRFAYTTKSHGYTNDSVKFIVRPNLVSAPGQYTDTIVCLVQGVVQPAKILVHLNALQSGNPQCGKLGDISGNNISYEVADLVLLQSALVTGSVSYLGTMIGNADVNADCLIDSADLVKMQAIIDGSALPLPGCGNCASYQFIPFQNPLCNLPGDVNQNGLPWEVADLALLDQALLTGDPSLLMPLIGNSDLDGNCSIDTVDRVRLEAVILGIDTAPGGPCGTCANYTFLGVDTVGNPSGDSAWVVPRSLSLFAPFGSTSIVYQDVILASTVAGSYSASHTRPTEWLLFDSAGITNDSVHLGADPTGLQPGPYADTIIFLVSGVSYPVFLPVMLFVTGADSVQSTPSREVTLSNYPNPFNPSTECVFSIPTASHVLLKVYDVMGREVITLVDEEKAAGKHRVLWRGQTSSGNQAASGVYLYRIEANGVSLTRKMLLLK